MDTTVSSVSLKLSREAFRWSYLLLVLLGMGLALLLTFLGDDAPAATVDRLLWGAYLITFVLYALNPLSVEGAPARDVLGMLLPLLATYLTFNLLAAVLLLLTGMLIASMAQYAHLSDGLVYRVPRGRRRFLQEKILPQLVAVGAGLLSGAAAYSTVGGSQPLTTLQRSDLLHLAILLGVALGLRSQIMRLPVLRGERPLYSVYPLYVRAYWITLDLLLTIPAIVMTLLYYQGSRVLVGLSLLPLLLGALGLRVLTLSRSALYRRIDELSTLNIVSKALITATTPPMLFEALFQQVNRLIDAPVFYIAIPDPERRSISYPLVVENYRRVHWPDRPWGEGPVEFIIQQRTALLSQDGQDPLLRAGCAPPCRTFLGVPIQLRDTVYGVLAVQHPTVAGAYTVAEQNVLETIASQAASVLRNLHLRNEAQKFTDGLLAVNHVSNVVNASLNSDVIFREICSVACDVSGASGAAIFLRGQKTASYHIAHSVGLPDGAEAALARTLIDNQGGWYTLLSWPRITSITDLQDDSRTSWLAAALSDTPLHGMMVVPFISVRDQINGQTLTPAQDALGFVAVFFNQPHTPGENQRYLLQMVANQAATAIENSRLFEETQRNVQRLAYLVETARVFSESLALDKVTESVVIWTVEVLNVDSAMLTLWDREEDCLVVQAHASRRDGMFNPPPALLCPLSEIPELTGVLQSRWSRAFAAGDPTLSPALRDVFVQAGLQTLVFIPLAVRDTVLGALVLGKADSDTLDSDDISLAEAIAIQVATAVENARFHQLTEVELSERVLEINVLENVLRRISASTDEVSIIRELLDAAYAVTHADLLGCALIEPGGILLDAESSGISAGNPLSLYWRLGNSQDLQHRQYSEANHSVVGEVLRTRQPLLVDDVTQLPHYWLPEGTLGFASELCVPILHQEQTLGVLNLESRRIGHFSEAHLRFLQNLAGHAAIALNRARLFASNQRQIEILEAIRVLSLDLLQAADLETVLTRVCNVALSILNGVNIHIYFYDPATDVLTFAASLWHDGRRNYEIAHPRPDGLTYRALRAGHSVISDDFERFPGVPTRRLGIFPLVHQGQPVGVLNAAVRQPEDLGEGEVRAMELLTNQAASAIERVRLFESRQRQIEILESLRRNSVALLNTTHLSQVLDVVCQTALMMVDAETVHIYFYDQDTDRLTFAASLYRDGRRNLDPHPPRSNGVTHRTAVMGRSQRLSLDQLYVRDPSSPITALQSVPLKHGDAVIGVLNVAVRDIGQLGSDEISALELLANQAAAAILNARLYEEIRKRRDHMAVILGATRDGLLLVDRHGILLHANPAAERLLGAELRPYLGKHLLRALRQLALQGLPPEDFRHPEVIKTIWRSLRENPRQPTMRHAELVQHGQTIYLEEESTPVLAEDGSVIGRLFVWRDVTAQRQLEKGREELTHTIVHDLRSPLSSIKGGLSVLRDMLTDDEALDRASALEVVSIAEGGAEGLLALVNSLLDVAHMESGDMPLNLVSASLHEPVGQAMRVLEMLAKEENVKLVCELPDDLPLLFMDSGKITRVFTNLIDNALHYTPPGGCVSVRAKYLPEEGVILATVEDNGPGVPPEMRERIFDRYATGLSGAPRRAHRGLGLGLTFCKLAVEAHGGRIWVEDSRMGGAAFRFTLPLVH